MLILQTFSKPIQSLQDDVEQELDAVVVLPRRWCRDVFPVLIDESSSEPDQLM